MGRLTTGAASSRRSATPLLLLPPADVRRYRDGDKTDRRGVVALDSAKRFTEFSLDAVAAFEGCVQAGDGVRAVHAFNMRIRASNRE